MFRIPKLCVLLLLASGNALACKCPQTSLTEKLQDASIAFVGSIDADPTLERKDGEAIPFVVSRPLKGNVKKGATISVDPSFNSDCAAPIVMGVQLLVFAYGRAGEPPKVVACSVRTVEPISIDGELLQPSSDVAEFLRSVSN